jgi:hypothetical protein
VSRFSVEWSTGTTPGGDHSFGHQLAELLTDPVEDCFPDLDQGIQPGPT